MKGCVITIGSPSPHTVVASFRPSAGARRPTWWKTGRYRCAHLHSAPSGSQSSPAPECMQCSFHAFRLLDAGQHLFTGTHFRYSDRRFALKVVPVSCLSCTSQPPHPQPILNLNAFTDLQRLLLPLPLILNQHASDAVTSAYATRNDYETCGRETITKQNLVTF